MGRLRSGETRPTLEGHSRPPACSRRPLVLPTAVAARAAVLAFGDELLVPDSVWDTPGGRDFAAAYLLSRAEATLRHELQQLADAAKSAHHAQSSSSNVL